MAGWSYLAQPLSKRSSLVELLCARAEQQPDQRAFTFLIDGETGAAGMSYGEIDRQARAIAASLMREGIEGERVLLLYPPGLAFVPAFYGTLYAGAIAVTAPMPLSHRLSRTLPRLEAVARDAQPKVALTTSEAMREFEKILPLSPELRSMRWLATDTVSMDASADWREPEINLQTPAFLQYTSGSTSSPKGVMVSHASLLHNSECIRLTWRYAPESVSVMWVPHIHDHGLLDGIIQPVYTGFHCILMPNVSFIQQPVRWLQAISRHGATHSGGPNFAYDLCVKKVQQEQLATLNLSSWCTALNAAEPIRKETLVRFAETFEPCGFRRRAFFPAYGLAESTLVVSGGHDPIFITVEEDALAHNRVVEASDDQQNAHTLVGCGKAMPGTRIVIAQPEKRMLCAADEIGEIWVSSQSVGQGYWNNAEETSRIFQAFLADSGDGPFLRTGDLGFLKDGELFVTGRLKDLIIIRGYNHYPQDIEYTVEKSHPALRAGCSAAFSVEADGEERVAIVVEVARRADAELDVKPVYKAIRKAVAEEHDLSVYAIKLLKPGTIPKTSSGKIQRTACRNGFLTESLQTVEE
jgi:acyl-CoA synthetase (AMP-forming)/AMP-acid ligase II